MTRKIFYNNWGLRKMKMIPTIWNFRPKQLIMRTFKCYKNIFSFFYTLFKTKKDVLSLIELVKRTLSGPSVLDSFYYPRFFRYKKT